MPRNTNIQIPAVTWTQLTDENVTNIRVQNHGSSPIYVMATNGAVAPTSVNGAIVLHSGEFFSADVTLAELFPGVSGPNRVYAYSNASVPVSVSHNATAAPSIDVAIPATAPYGSGTREHNTSAMSRQAVGSASARVALPALGASREVYVMPNTRCFFVTGSSTVTAAAGSAHPLAQDERFYFRVPAGHTHIAFIRDTADGFINICPVA